MAGTYVSGQAGGPLSVWKIDRLWELAGGLEVRHLRLDRIDDFDENMWFRPGGEAPTCRAIAAHAKRIFDADLDQPVILSAEGHVMDGMHRIARAWILGLEEIKAVRFEETPPPDGVLSADSIPSGE